MGQRATFVMSKEQLNKLLDACKPVPLIAIHAGPIRTPQQNANDAWEALGKEMGFKYMTVRPIPGKGQEHFTAEIADDDGN